MYLDLRGSKRRQCYLDRLTLYKLAESQYIPLKVYSTGEIFTSTI